MIFLEISKNAEKWVFGRENRRRYSRERASDGEWCDHFVDGFYVLEQLAREDPEAFTLLATVPVRFENNGGDNSSALWSSLSF